MKILALEHEIPGATSDHFADYARAEAREAWKLHLSGVLRELYFRADRREAVLVLECGTLEDAERVLQNLPYVREGLIRFELIPLTAYTGFARLFGDEESGEIG